MSYNGATQVEIPQELADTIASRFAGVSVEEYVVRTVLESIDEASDKPSLRQDSPLRAMALNAKADVQAGRTVPLP